MSRILDILKHEGRKKADSIQEQLAEIYISPTKKKRLDDKKGVRLEKILTYGWVVLILALASVSAVSLALLFSNNKINIIITVIKEEPLVQPAPVEGVSETKIAEGRRLHLKNLPSHTISFGGSADMESKLTDQYLYLVNSRGMGWASAKINFSEPINLIDNILSFSVKGGRGGEVLHVIVRDTNGKTYQAINVAPNGLSKDWQTVTVYAGEAGHWIDLASVSRLTLEFGSVTTKNAVDAAIYIKDIILIKKTPAL